MSAVSSSPSLCYPAWRQSVGLDLLRPAFAVAAVAIFFTNFENYLKSYVAFLIPLFWILGFAGAALMLVLERQVAERQISLSPLILRGYIYLVISALWLIPAWTSSQGWQQLRSRAVVVIFLSVIPIILATRRAQHAARVAMIYATLLGVALNLFEVFHPGQFSTIVGRSAGLYRNSNQSGAALLLG